MQLSKLIRLLTKTLAALVWVIYKPWCHGAVLKEVETQMHFWHRIESDAIANARKSQQRGDFRKMQKHLAQARVARLRCEREMSRLDRFSKSKNPKQHVP